jgi:hypothetical protein
MKSSAGNSSCRPDSSSILSGKHIQAPKELTDLDHDAAHADAMAGRRLTLAIRTGGVRAAQSDSYSSTSQKARVSVSLAKKPMRRR